jgi:hypothetical protein
MSSFTLEDFQEALDEVGVDWKISHSSINVKECPACGSSKYKVIFRLEPDEDEGIFFGKCLRGSCSEGYSSIKYLTMMGMERQKAIALHGKDPSEALRGLSEIDKKTAVKNTLPEVVQQVVDTSNFIPIETLPDHAVAKYAVRRGYVKELSDVIQMDLQDNSVVFLVNDGFITLGYQKRFISPLANPKTKTSTGFNKDNMLIFYRPDPAPVAVCEGPFTALSAWHYEMQGVCTFGANISKNQMEQIIDMGRSGREVFYAAENDDQASDKSLRSFKAAMSWAGIPFQIIRSTIGKDLNDAWEKGGGYTIEEPSGDNIWLPKIDKLF